MLNVFQSKELLNRWPAVDISVSCTTLLQKFAHFKALERLFKHHQQVYFYFLLLLFVDIFCLPVVQLLLLLTFMLCSKTQSNVKFVDETSTNLNCCKNKSDQYFFCLNLLINLNSDQN